MKKVLYTVALVASCLGVLVGGVDSAQADRGYHNAQMCVSQYSGANETLIYRAPYGFDYFETTSGLVICPVRIDASGSINPTGARVKVYEFSAIDDISCTPRFVDDLFFTYLGTRYSCLTAGGCTSANRNVGEPMDGYLEWPDAEFPSGNRSGELSADFGCRLGANSGGSYMQIYSYEVTY